MRFHSKLVGVSFLNRQHDIGLLPQKPLESFVLGWKRERENPYDSNSVIVLASPYSNVEIGHLSREVAALVVPFVDAGAPMSILLTEVTGKDKHTKGVNVIVEVDDGKVAPVKAPVEETVRI